MDLEADDRLELRHGDHAGPAPQCACSRVDAGVGRVARLVARVLGLASSRRAPRRHEQVLLEDELLARVVGRGVHAGVHADGVAGARLDAVAAEDAAQLVDHERARGSARSRGAGRPRGYSAGVDVDALRGARREQHRQATQRGEPSSRMREAVHAAEALRVGALLLGVADGLDALLERLEHRIGALAERISFVFWKKWRIVTSMPFRISGTYACGRAVRFGRATGLPTIPCGARGLMRIVMEGSLYACMRGGLGAALRGGECARAKRPRSATACARRAEDGATIERECTPPTPTSNDDAWVRSAERAAERLDDARPALVDGQQGRAPVTSMLASERAGACVQPSLMIWS